MCFRNIRIRLSRSAWNPRSSEAMYSVYSSWSNSALKMPFSNSWRLAQPTPCASHALRRFSLLANTRKGLLVTNLVLGFKSSGEGSCFL